MNNVIVTGADGFLGKYLIEKLLQEGKNILAIVRRKDSIFLEKNEYSKLFAIKCDISNSIELGKKIKETGIEWDTLYHLAWEGTSGDRRKDVLCQEKNIANTIMLIALMSELKIQNFIGSGSLAEIECKKYVLEDGSTPNPVAMYAAAKLALHMMSKIECNRLGINHIWGIFSNIYGVGDTTNNFVNFAATLMLSGKRASFTTGEQLYDFIYIDDFINALYLMGERGKNNHCYFLGNGSSRKLKEYIYCIRDEIDPRIPLYFGEVPYNGISLTEEELDISKAEKDLGFQPKVAFEEGIRRTIMWLKNETGELK